MRVDAKLPAWMIADGEYHGVAVGDEHDFGFALVPHTISAGSGEQRWNQEGITARVSGIVSDWGFEVPPVLDDGVVFPIISSAEPVPRTGAALVVEGQLLVEPYLWAPHGLLRTAAPRGVGSWTVTGIQMVLGDEQADLDVLPDAVSVDHDAAYVLRLVRL